MGSNTALVVTSSNSSAIQGFELISNTCYGPCINTNGRAYQTTPGSTSCVEVCLPGFNTVGNQCVSETTPRSSPVQPTVCPIGTVLAQDGKCYQPCEIGYAGDDRKCAKICPMGQTDGGEYCIPNNNRDKCAPGFKKGWIRDGDSSDSDTSSQHSNSTKSTISKSNSNNNNCHDNKCGKCNKCRNRKSSKFGSYKPPGHNNQDSSNSDSENKDWLNNSNNQNSDDENSSNCGCNECQQKKNGNRRSNNRHKKSRDRMMVCFKPEYDRGHGTHPSVCPAGFVLGSDNMCHAPCPMDMIPDPNNSTLCIHPSSTGQPSYTKMGPINRSTAPIGSCVNTNVIARVESWSLGWKIAIGIFILVIIILIIALIVYLVRRKKRVEIVTEEIITGPVVAAAPLPPGFIPITPQQYIPAPGGLGQPQQIVYPVR